MKFVRIRAVAKKEIIQIRRDPLSLTIAFLMPLIQLFIFGYAISFDINNIDTVIYDRDRSYESRELVSEMSASGYFSIVGYVDSYREVDSYIELNKAKVALMIRDDFSRAIKTGRPVQVGVVIDGSDSNTATIADGYLNGIALQFSARMSGVKIEPIIDIRNRVWYNPELKSRNFIVPGLIVVIMAVIVALLTSLTIAREWERGTMEQLISTPVKPAELIIGKIAPYFMIGLIDIIVAIIAGVFWFGVPIYGSPLLLLALSCIFMFGGVCTGIIISINARGSQSVASQVALITSFLPALLLSGFVFAISNMPAPLQIVTYVIPARYFVTISKSIFMKGSGIDALITETLLLTLYGTLVFAVAVKKFRKRID